LTGAACGTTNLRMKTASGFLPQFSKHLIALSLLAPLGGVACGHTVAHGSTPALGAPVQGVTVTGFGKASGQPNIARATVGVEVRAGTAEQAIGDVNTRMAQVIAALKQQGIADKDLRTSSLSLNFEQSHEYPPRPFEEGPVSPEAPKPARPPAGSNPAPGGAAEPPPKLPRGFYRAANMLEITVRNLAKAGQVLSAATSAGADQMFGIHFELEDPSALQAEARQKAVADARVRAERLAQLAGVRLGQPVSITEMDGGQMPPPMPMMMRADAAQAQVPVERGELTITTTVQIVYALPEDK
jgi:uncharacterized protein YggE